MKTPMAWPRVVLPRNDDAQQAEVVIGEGVLVETGGAQAAEAPHHAPDVLAGRAPVRVGAGRPRGPPPAARGRDGPPPARAGRPHAGRGRGERMVTYDLALTSGPASRWRGWP